ncbi:MAG TPA: hypothetical protein PKL56_16155 [Cyclobacteriaceae bacterium]|nr:hypothetical protein [Cyclobacteriaceae bacterium]HMX88070.1 hypothetical protein [Saprospiraceae bacterium]HMX00903.1 hypothetical protein [Cyclobacteriaceae bacterium]HMY93707.1 hypothetical protein [Cyclobacteriaceae bacterium]HNA12859.1 hypothetical protein [Cyclobacteriaceae bacterium]
MKLSIIDILKAHKYDTTHLIDDPLVIKIDKLFADNNCLNVTFTDEGMVNFRKKLNYSYNIKIQIIDRPNGWIIYDQIIGKMGIPIKLSYIYEGLLKILKRNEGRSNISGEELKLTKEKEDLEEQKLKESVRKKILNEIKSKRINSKPTLNKPINDQLSDSNLDLGELTEEDPFSERNIMKDLENGEGEKHGF